jgi:hypothetical protein
MTGEPQDGTSEASNPITGEQPAPVRLDVFSDYL